MVVDAVIFVNQAVSKPVCSFEISSRLPADDPFAHQIVEIGVIILCRREEYPPDEGTDIRSWFYGLLKLFVERFAQDTVVHHGIREVVLDERYPIDEHLNLLQYPLPDQVIH